MAGAGFFAGGMAEGFQAQQELGLRSRALKMQQESLQQQQQQQLRELASKRIASTMDTIGKVIENGKVGVGSGDDMAVYGNAISGIETGGQAAPYSIVHPPAPNGDRALGKYGVMTSNVAPWTQEVLGKALTPEQFLASPEAQEAVFKAKFGQFIEQNGGSAADAASVWFTGRPLAQGADSSDGNMTGQQYVDKFLKNVASAPQARISAAVEPLLQSVEGLAGSIGEDPTSYRNQAAALIATTPTPVDKAIAAGAAAGTEKLAEANTLIKAGISSIDARISAGLLSADRAKAEGGTGGQPALEPDKKIQYEGQLRDDYTNLSKDFISARQGYERVKAAYDNPQAEAGISDIALVFGYMKLLDPNSTVREGEAASVRDAQGVPSQVLNLYNRLVSGASLSQDGRDSIMSLSEKFYSKWQTQHDVVVQRFTDIANRSGLDPQNIVLDFNTAERPAPPPDAGGDLQEGTIIRNDAGERRVLRGGAWVPLQ